MTIAITPIPLHPTPPHSTLPHPTPPRRVSAPLAAGDGKEMETTYGVSSKKHDVFVPKLSSDLKLVLKVTITAIYTAINHCVMGDDPNWCPSYNAKIRAARAHHCPTRRTDGPSRCS